MKTVHLGISKQNVPAIVVGCMRFADMSVEQMEEYIQKAMEVGTNFFDHADIYGKGGSEEIFGKALAMSSSIKRSDLIIQSKCGIRSGFYDLSKDYIINSVDASLKRLHTEYLDMLLLHRPDALVEPEEVAAAFEELSHAGKVRNFGVSNHKPMQIELLKKYVRQDLLVNQMQFSIPVSNMVANGMEVNMTTDGSIDRDGSALDYCRLKGITIQAWSPFQMPAWRGNFIGNPDCEDLNTTLIKMAQKYSVTVTTMATAWILRHPANMQMIAGTTKISRLEEIANACTVDLSREDWYQLYLAAGHILP